MSAFQQPCRQPCQPPCWPPFQPPCRPDGRTNKGILRVGFSVNFQINFLKYHEFKTFVGSSSWSKTPVMARKSRWRWCAVWPPGVRTASDFLVQMERGEEMRPPAPTPKMGFQKCISWRKNIALLKQPGVWKGIYSQISQYISKHKLCGLENYSFIGWPTISKERGWKRN